MKTNIENALKIINAMRVDGDNQELAVAAKNELKQALQKLESQRHEYVSKINTEDGVE